jgi:hypothetical protein
MKSSIRTFSLLFGIVWSVVPGIDAQVNVTQKHNNLSRDGLYIDSAFTPAAAAGLTRDLNFDGTISGNVYAQPLYIEGGPSGPMVIAVAESKGKFEGLNQSQSQLFIQIKSANSSGVRPAPFFQVDAAL